MRYLESPPRRGQAMPELVVEALKDAAAWLPQGPSRADAICLIQEHDL